MTQVTMHSDSSKEVFFHPLYSKYQEAIAAGPARRARELASELNMTEGDLVACRQGVETFALKLPFQDILAKLVNVGEVLTITRNDEAVHETKGVYHRFQFVEKNQIGLVLSSNIDLRLFIGQWHSAYSVIENNRHSVQFFNAYGLAVHKVYCTENTDLEQWQALVDLFRDPSPTVPTYLSTVSQDLSCRNLPETFDAVHFSQAWASLKDVHDYHAMLEKFQLTRIQALQQIGAQWATKLAQDSVVNAITYAKEEQCDIMVFVGNPGCIQIFSGKVDQLLMRGPWFNVLDPAFNLHLRADLIEQAWVIERPSGDGIITSIEAFNGKGESILTLFGRRKPGEPELALWRQIVEKVKSRLFLTEPKSTDIENESESVNKLDQSDELEEI